MAEIEQLGGVVGWKDFQLESTEFGLQFRYQFQPAHRRRKRGVGGGGAGPPPPII